MMGFRLNLWARPLRRLMAFVTLLAFAPSSVLAAMPLVLCAGADGHYGIEYSLRSPGPPTVHHSLPNIGEPQDHASVSKTSGCQDWQLLDKSKVGAEQIEGLITLDSRVAIVLPALLALTLAADVPHPLWAHSRAGPPASHLGARRSVVLRI